MATRHNLVWLEADKDTKEYATWLAQQQLNGGHRLSAMGVVAAIDRKADSLPENAPLPDSVAAYLIAQRKAEEKRLESKYLNRNLHADSKKRKTDTIANSPAYIDDPIADKTQESRAELLAEHKFNNPPQLSSYSNRSKAGVEFLPFLERGK